MAAGATIHTFDVDLSDVDRGVYESFSLRAAKHPSETEAFLITRVLAYCLEYVDGIAFSEGISTKEEPAVLVRDATGAITTWVEIGAPDASRLHSGSKQSERTVVYTHRDPEKVAAPWTGKRIHGAERIELRSFQPGFVDRVVAALGRRNALTVSVMEGRLYLELGGESFDSELLSRPAQG